MRSTSSNIEDHRIPNNRSNSIIPSNQLQENNLCIQVIFSLSAQTRLVRHTGSLFSMIRFPVNKPLQPALLLSVLLQGSN